MRRLTAPDVVDPNGQVVIAGDRLVCLATHAGDPVPCPRPRVARAGGIYYPDRYVQHRDALSWAMKAGRIMSGPSEDPLGIMLRFWRATRRRVDLDNLTKTVLDAGTGIIWEDDDQICEVHARLFTGQTSPRTEVIAYLAREGGPWDVAG